MENKNKQTQQLLSQKAGIIAACKTLKTEFIGLDHVIDEIETLITPWVLFPDAQMRPTIINLWGLTGSGKTALVERLVDLINKRDYFVKFDMGEYESSSAGWIKQTFTDDLEYAHEKEVIICLDEFQFSRTIDKSGNELGKDKLRVIWDVLDSGKISYVASNSSFYVKRGELCIMHLLRSYDKGIVIRDGLVVDKEDEFKIIFLDYYFESSTRYNTVADANYFLSEDFLEGMESLYNDDNVTKEVIKRAVLTSDLESLIKLIQKGLRNRFATKCLDLSKALIFVIGNLDEAFRMSHSLNPDISADELYEATRKISITNIKEALKHRFRNEQIARLGNNHVIYTAFKNEHYELFIRQQLSRIETYAKSKFGFQLSFDNSVLKVIYKEGVFPAQGTRPVLSTVKNIIESKLGKLVMEKIERAENTVNIKTRFEENTFIAEFYDSANKKIHSFSELTILKLDSLRQSNNPDLQSHTAVHEAGHAIVAALTLRILPAMVVSKTASASADGFCLINFPEGLTTRDVLKKDIMISLGGYVAERIVFGDENTSTGVVSDIENASTLANRAIREYAMGSDPIKLVMAASQDNEAFVVQQKYHDEALSLVNECKYKAEELLIRNKKLLLCMSDYLTTHSRMNEEEIGKMVIEFAADEWVRSQGFVKKDNYYAYRSVIAYQLSQTE